MALLTIFVALSFYFVQDDLKRLLAYSTIAHLGYVLLGIAVGGLGSTIGFRGGVLHIICHGYSKATLFFCAGAIAYVTGTRSISALRGLGRSMPLTATAFFIGLLSVTGVPPLACFWSKFMILSGAVRLHGAIGPINPHSHPLRNFGVIRLDALHRTKNLSGRSHAGGSSPRAIHLGP